MEKTRKTFAVLFALASLPMAAFADTTSPGATAPPMAGSGGMMGKRGDPMMTNPTAPAPKG